jgi:hypothetical protein
MVKTSKSGLPHGVSEYPTRPGTYRFSYSHNGLRNTDYFRPDAAEITTGKGNISAKLLNPLLVSEYNKFKERVERGAAKNSLRDGNITDKSTFAQAVEWFIGIRKLELRESTQIADTFLFEHYLIPRLGKFKLREITSPVVTKLLAELLERGGGGGRAVYAAREEFIKYI